MERGPRQAEEGSLYPKPCTPKTLNPKPKHDLFQWNGVQGKLKKVEVDARGGKSKTLLASWKALFSRVVSYSHLFLNPEPLLARSALRPKPSALDTT